MATFTLIPITTTTRPLIAQLVFGLLLPNVGFGQTDFRNLDFEAARVPDLPPGAPGEVVTRSDALPGWLAMVGQITDPSIKSQFS